MTSQADAVGERDPMTVALARVDDALLAIQAQTIAASQTFDLIEAGWAGEAATALRSTRAVAAGELRAVEVALRHLRQVLEQSRRRRPAGGS